MGRIIQAAGPETAAFVIVGGDGTVREAVSGPAPPEKPLWVLPTGTENLFAKELGYSANFVDFVEALASRRVACCDLAFLNGRPFLTIAGFGFDADAVVRLHNQRQGHIHHLSYFWPLWRTFWEHRFPSIRVVADGKEIWLGRSMVFIGNLARYALGLKILSRARWNDGLLDVCILPCTGRIQFVTRAIAIAAGRHDTSTHVIYRQCRSLRLESPSKVAVQLDGDPGGRLPATIEIAPRRIKLLLPGK
jgi:diacylglycerol kinase (ATP)